MAEKRKRSQLIERVVTAKDSHLSGQEVEEYCRDMRQWILEHPYDFDEWQARTLCERLQDDFDFRIACAQNADKLFEQTSHTTKDYVSAIQETISLL